MPVRGVQRVDGVLWERTQAEACASLVVELGQLRVAVVEARGRNEILPLQSVAGPPFLRQGRH
jgi:hypothetical protein